MRKAANLPKSCAVVAKSGKLNFLEHPGTLQTCNRADLPLLTRRFLDNFNALTNYSDTSANEDNSFRNHIGYPKRDFP